MDEKMEMQKIGLLENMRLTLYGIRQMHKLTPKYFPLGILRALVQTAQPAAALYFSARILNELAGARDVRAIIIYVVSAVLSAFALSAAKALLTREINMDGDW
ncbi:MAG: hypothetical protein LBD16_01115, partial [Oscillospiraceae bacterium]|nr:hypothetical protein [Oscillospiraceae bacterium]